MTTRIINAKEKVGTVITDTEAAQHVGQKVTVEGVVVVVTNSGFTLLFEAFVMLLAEQIPVAAIARWFRKKLPFRSGPFPNMCTEMSLSKESDEAEAKLTKTWLVLPRGIRS